MLDHVAEWFGRNETVALKNLVASAVILVVALIVYAVGARALGAGQRRHVLAPPVLLALRMLLRWTVGLLALLLVLDQLGVLENVWAAIVAVLAMVAVGFFAVWSVLSNVMCTLLLLVYKPFTVGDRVELPTDGLAGQVIDLNAMYTILRAEDGAIIQIPQNTFFQKPIRCIPGKEKISLHEQLAKETPSE